MNRIAAVVGLLLVLLGLALFVWKAVVLELPLAATDAEGLWRVELEITARGTGRRGSIRAPLPSTGPAQVVFDERSASDRLLFTIRTESGDRIGVWSGRLAGVHQLVHGFRVQLAEVATPLPSRITRRPSSELLARWGDSTREFPSDAPEVKAFLEGLWPSIPENRLDCLRTLFGFVADEIATVASASDDALLTLSAREGSAVGKSRLLVTLLRAVGLPARTVLGLQLAEGQPPSRRSGWRRGSTGTGFRCRRSTASSRPVPRTWWRCAPARWPRSRPPAWRRSAIATTPCASACAPRSWRR